MARIILNGDPGAVHTNDTGRVQFQFFASLVNTCGVCLQYHHAIGPWWPIPIHHGCRCHQERIAPGQTAKPFVDFREVLDKLPDDQKRAAVGASNYKLIKEGVVQWNDVVTRTRVRDLREVVSINRLSVDKMKSAGVNPKIAERAYAAVHTPAHELAIQKRAELIGRLKTAGINAPEIQQGITSRIVGRVSIGGGPSGLSAMPVKPFTPKAPPSLLAMPLVAPKYGPSKATVTVAEDVGDASRKIFDRELSGTEWATIGGATNDANVAVSVPDKGPVKVEWETKSGIKSVRYVDKTESGTTIDNAGLWVPKELQGKGIGREVFGRQVEEAQRLGAKQITTFAEKSSESFGYDVWPKFGYDAPIPERIKPIVPPAFGPIENVSDLMKTSEGREWWTKNGVGLEMTFDLTPGSQSLRVWEAYQKAKGTIPTSRGATSP